jgi:hypothetical protein
MLIATFGPTTGWAGKTIVREGDAFMLEGHGPISAANVMEYDRQGHLIWVTDGQREWVAARAGVVRAAQPAAQKPTVTAQPLHPRPRTAQPLAQRPTPKQEHSNREILHAMLDRRDAEGLYMAALDRNRRLSSDDRSVAHWYLRLLADKQHNRKARRFIEQLDAEEIARLTRAAAEMGRTYSPYHYSAFDYSKHSKYMRLLRGKRHFWQVWK